VQHDVPRDKRLMYESLNGDYGFFLRSSKLIESRRRASRTSKSTRRPSLESSFRLDGCFMTSEREEFVYHETLIHPRSPPTLAPGGPW